jgi:PAS domain S-box-containing protein
MEISRPRRAVQGCALMLAVNAALLASAALGWFPPLPSVWFLLAIGGATRAGGVASGAAAGAAAVALALSTDGFTITHAADLGVWGRPHQRVVAFAVATAIIVAATSRWRSNAVVRRTEDVWGRSSGNEAWLIAELDMAGAVRNVNAAGARLLGYAPDQMCGRSLSSMTHSSDLDQLARALLRLHRGRRTEALSVRLLTASGVECSLVGRAFRVSEAGHVVLTAAPPELTSRS